MEVSGRRNVSEIRHVSCDPCLSDGDNETAVYFCTLCNEFLCNVCGKVHKKTRVTKYHTILEGDELPSRKNILKDGDFCSRHEDSPVEFYCHMHAHLCCSICKHSFHNECQVDLISDLASGIDIGKEYEDMISNMQDLSDKMEEMKDTAINNSEVGRKSYNQLISDVRRFRSNIDHLLNKHERHILNEARQITTDGINNSELVSTTCDVLQAEITRMLSYLENKRVNCQTRQLFVASRKGGLQLNVFENQLSELPENKVMVYSFACNEVLSTTVQACHSLGKLQFRHDEVVYSKRHNVQQPTTGLERRIDVRHQQDTDRCKITGLCIAEDNKLALVDRSNCCVKFLDLYTDTICEYVKLKDQPFDIAYRGNNQLVVTCDNNLTFLNMKTTPVVVDDNKTVYDLDHVYRGIAYGNGKFVVTLIKPTGVKIIDDQSLVTLDTFDNSNLGEQLFDCPLYVCYAKDKALIYVSDSSRNTITALDMAGSVKHSYNTETNQNRLSEPQGLSIGANCLYVAGRWSHNVHQITTDLRQSHDLLKHKVETHPTCLTYCKIYNKLYLAHASGLRDIISVFKMTKQEQNTNSDFEHSIPP